MPRSFLLFTVAYAVSTLGTSMMPVVLTFLVLHSGGSSGTLGLVLAAETAPVVCLIFLGGVVADRISRRWVMISADLIRFVAEIFLFATLAVWHFNITIVLIVSALIGVGNALFAPSFEGIIPNLVQGDYLQRANATIAVVASAAGILGPGIGGLLASVVGPGWAAFLDALTYAASAGCLLGLSLQERKIEPTDTPLQQLAVGWREFLRHRWLQLKVAQSALLNLLVIGPIWVIGPAAVLVGREDGKLWGYLLAALSFGEVVGGILALRLDPVFPLRSALIWFFPFFLAPLALAVSAPIPLLLGAFCASGVCLAAFSVLWSTTLQTQIPEDVLSRVSSYDAFCSICLLPVGYLLAQPVQMILGGSGGLILASAVSVLSTVCMLFFKDVRFLKR